MTISGSLRTFSQEWGSAAEEMGFPKTRIPKKDQVTFKERAAEGSDVVIIDCLGGAPIVIGDSEALGEKIKSLVSEGHTKLVLNMENVPWIDSAGLGEIMSGYSKTKGGLTLLNLQKRVEDMLKITKLITLFKVFDDEKMAVASYGAAAAPSAEAPKDAATGP